MYSKVLVPLDGSTTAEHVLPFVRCLARALSIPVQLIAVVDIVEMARNVSASNAVFLDTLTDDAARRCTDYLNSIAKNFPVGSVHCAVAKGNAADAIIESAAADKQTLIAMATHGRSGASRWLVGSVAEKVLRGAANHLLLVRAKEEPPDWDMAALKSVVVALDGSELAETVLPAVEGLARALELEVILLRIFGIPYGAYASGEGFYDANRIEGFIAGLRTEAVEYLERKAAELKRKGLEKVSIVAKEGLNADEIISFARDTPDNLIAMCTHGRAGVKRWALGSVAETVARHSGDPVLIIRAPS